MVKRWCVSGTQGLQLACAIILLVFAMPAVTSAQFAFTITYNYTTNNGTITTNGAVAITRYTGAATDVVIPTSTNGYPVTGIGSGAFESCTNLTSVSIPDGVITIGSQAFIYCYSLTNVTIPNTVTNIGDSAFMDCSNLTGVILPNSLTSVATQTFVACGLASITIPDSVSSIAQTAFLDCQNLTNVTLPGSLLSIGDFAFGRCTNLHTVFIPGSVTNIWDTAFNECSGLTAIMVDTQNPAYSSLGGVLFNKNQTILIEYPCGIAGSYNVPNGVTSIGDQAFPFCEKLTDILIPNTVTNIGAYGFYYCPSLTSLILPDSIASIGDYAFVECTGLTNVSFGNGLTSIGNWAFDGCFRLTSVNVGDNLIVIGFKAFSDCSRLTSFNFPGSITNIGDEAFWDCGSLTNIAIPANVIHIGSAVFYGCLGLKSITVDQNNQEYSSLAGVLFNKAQTILIACPGGMTGNYAIPDTVTNIADFAFGRSFLENVEIPTSVQTIGDDAFLQCGALTNITIPNSVTSIGNAAFDDCPWLASITVGSGVTNLGDYAFALNVNLASVFFAGDAVTNVGSNTFYFDDAVIYYLPGTIGWSDTYVGLSAVLWDPTIQINDGNFGVKSNQFGFNIVGTTNIPIVIEACTNVSGGTWIPLQSASLTNGSFYFSDSVWTNSSSRFYRIRSP